MANIDKAYPATLHYNASPFTRTQAKTLRKPGTDAEIRLWKELRNRRCGGLKFRRQHPYNRFILDFYCHEKGLAVEVDGGIHNNPEVIEHDTNRTFELEDLGVRIIRFKNEEVFRNIDEVLMRIIQVAETS